MKITVSSSNKIHFNKTSEDLLCADYGYELKKVDGLYYIHKNGVPVTWSGGFIDVNAAEKFLSKHDYVNATEDSIDYNITELDRTQLIYVIDWLNAHHFDYRGLIEKGLALEAPEDMYKI